MLETQQSKGFVLHSRRFRENSRIIECFTQDYGRVAVVAQLSRKKNSSNTSKFQPFRELALQWRGKSELQTLQQADEIHHMDLGSPANICGLYCNELILSLTSKFIPMHSLYDVYEETLMKLGEETRFEPVLRRFEMTLLEELGYGFDLDFQEQADLDSAANREYFFHPAHGLSQVNQGSGSMQVSSATVAALRNQDFSQQESVKPVKMVLSSAIDYLLDGKVLKSRQLFRDLVRIST